MLALATHEVHFSILREVVYTPGQQDKCFICGQIGHLAATCEGKAKRKAGEYDEKEVADVIPKKPYQFLNIWTLREYLEYELRIPNPPFKTDFERMVDDFIFMCFFVGNDFLPHMPTLEIREGAINLLLAVYKKEFRTLGGYLTNGSKPDLSKVEQFIQAVGSYEDKIFQKRAQLHQRQADRIKRDKAQAKSRTTRGDDVAPQAEPDSLVPVSRFQGSRLASGPTPSPYENGNQNHNRAHKVARLSSGPTVGAAIVEAERNLDRDIIDNKEELKIKLKEILREKSDVFNSEQPEEDKIRLGVPGWKERYYEQKFSANSTKELEELRRDVVLKYIEGLCWVMRYYYEGVCSWQWFYPYHYAPFASDLKDLGQLNISFELGSPFKPFTQLLAVFPAASSHALPEHYRKLMTDPNSPIADFYPTDFEVDMNGKRFAWQGIAKLPFIDEERLLAEVAKVEHTLTEDEARRNSMMPNMLFIALSHKLSPYIFSLDSRSKRLSNNDRIEVMEKIDPFASGGMNGYISLCAGDPCPTTFRSPIQGMDDIMDNQVICAIYKLPDYHKHIAQPPAGVEPPRKTVTLDDVQPEPVLWHEDFGKKPWENGRREHNRHHNPHRQLADAAQRLVVNNLQVKRDRNYDHHHVHDPRPHGPYNHDPIETVQPRSSYLPRYHRNYSNRHSGQWYASSSNQYNRLNTQMGQHGFSHGGGGYIHHGYRQPAVHHNRGLYVVQTPESYYPQHGGGYNYIPTYYQYNGSTNHHHHRDTAGRTPRGNTSTGRGHVSQRYQPYRR